MSKPRWTITGNRVEQWETEYTVKELGITGSEMTGLIYALADRIEALQATAPAPQQNTAEFDQFFRDNGNIPLFGIPSVKFLIKKAWDAARQGMVPAAGTIKMPDAKDFPAWAGGVSLVYTVRGEFSQQGRGPWHPDDQIEPVLGGWYPRPLPAMRARTNQELLRALESAYEGDGVDEVVALAGIAICLAEGKTLQGLCTERNIPLECPV